MLTTKDITKKDIVNMCQYLSEVFNNSEIKPEPICEGGIVFYDYENKFKTMRFGESGVRNKSKWPMIEESVMLDWENSSDIIFNKNSVFCLIFKGIKGDDDWSDQQVENMMIVLKNYNFKKISQNRLKYLESKNEY